MIRLLYCSIFSNIIIVLLFLTPASAKSIKVVASFLPVHSLVAAIMAGEGVPQLLVKGGASPHTFVMKPSSAQMLNGAQIVFWIGPQIEGYLVKPLASLSQKTLIVRLAKRIKSSSKFRLFSEIRHHEKDPHIWLDPRKAIEMANVIADALSIADFENATLYKKNRDITIAQLAQLENEITKIISPVSKVPHMVFHNAYGHFQKRFGLTSKGAVALDISRPIGAKRISMLRRRIVDLEIVCLFREPQFTSTIAKTIIDGTSTRLGVLDPLGSGLKPGPLLYPSMMRRLAKSFSDCLNDKG